MKTVTRTPGPSTVRSGFVGVDPAEIAPRIVETRRLRRVRGLIETQIMPSCAQGSSAMISGLAVEGPTDHVHLLLPGQTDEVDRIA